MTTIIKNGLVIDLSNQLHNYTNIIINDGKISTLTDKVIDADLVIDAKDLVVCPGFVDIHMHEGNNETFECLLRQGITSGLAGNCGENRCNPETFINEINSTGTSINMALLAGHGYYREKLCNKSIYEPLNSEDINMLCREMQKALNNGCIGISFGLEYIPGTTREEMIACAKLKGVKFISCHIRSCGPNAKSAIEEMISVAKEVNIPLEISHIGSMAGYGQMKECLAVIDKAREDGLKIYCDCYPYLAYATYIGSAVYDDGWQELMNCTYHDIEMCEGKYINQRLTKESFEEERKSHPKHMSIGHVIKQEDVDLAFSKEYTAVCTDATLDNGCGHPRTAGSFPRFISQFNDLDKAIYKCTALPAKHAGFKTKGMIKEGMDADFVIFNPKEIKDRATYDCPTLPPDGIKYVIINGEVAVSDKKIQKGNLGKAIIV